MKLCRCTGWLALWVLAAPGPAWATGPLGSNGSRIETSDYAVDLSQGLVLDGARPTALGGAYVAIAEGTDGMRQNPAAPAVRMPYSFSYFEYDIGLGATFPVSVASADYFNTGSRTTDIGTGSRRLELVFLNADAILQWGPWGLGIALDLQNYGLRQTTEASSAGQRDELRARFITGHLQLARSTRSLAVGGGVRLTGLSVVRTQIVTGSESELFASAGAALEAGAIWRPESLPFRVGASVHSAVTTDSAVVTDAVVYNDGDRILPGDPSLPDDFSTPGTIYLPNEVTLPWDVDVGVALQLGPRPLNAPWVNPKEAVSRLTRYLEWRRRERQRRAEAEVRAVAKAGGDVAAAEAARQAEELMAAALDDALLTRERQRVDGEVRRRYAELARFYLLISASLLITAPIDQGVGVESFLQRRVNRSGEHSTLSPRLGLESEAVPHHLKLRAGSYLEPTRFSSPGAAARLHGTFGVEVRLFPWTVFGLLPAGTVWRAGGMIDAAPRYFGWGLSLGAWH